MPRVQPTIVDEPELQRALDCGELVRLYQPVLDPATGALVQVEALLRWEHPDRGLLAPGEFLVDQDDSTLLVRIGWSVVIEAVRRAAAWRDASAGHDLTVSVNLFDDHLARRDLPSRVQHLLADHLVVEPHALAVEVGEHHLASRTGVRDRLISLRNVGVDVVVDDFGARAAAGTDPSDVLRTDALLRLEALTRFPLDVVKLDPRFVDRLGEVEHVREIVDGAHASGFRVVALGVEDDERADLVRAAGVDLVQGFHFERPARPSRIDELLAAR
jgi:EAL domain-containing protein (putative c-di-GMP-specific phosphodiesterase class I)